MIIRHLDSVIKAKLFKGKAIIIVGPRQTGKTTLLHQLFDSQELVLWLNGDDPETRLLLEDVNKPKWERIIGKNTVVVIDEAQRIGDIGIKLKLITDQIPQVQLIVTGSSALELASTINEPLTGRKWSYQFYPISFGELENHLGFVSANSRLDDYLVYGSYPEVLNNHGNEESILTQLADSYLYKDILIWDRIKKPEKILQLLQALAWQVGNEVSYSELGKLVGLDNETIEKYVQLLERSFVIFRLQPLSRNLRKEINSKRKIYFYDNGIRNAIIAQFQPLALRQDVGKLWENWFISERKKWLMYQGITTNTYFWRTTDQAEIDYIEERNGITSAFELKWNPDTKVRFPRAFLDAYQAHETHIVNRGNYFEFLGWQNSSYK
jgi:uncharacterized protein